MSHQLKSGFVGLALVFTIPTIPLLALETGVATKAVELVDRAAFDEIDARFAHIERVRLTGAEIRSHITLRDEFAAMFTFSDARPSEFTAHVQCEIVEVLKGMPEHNGRIRLHQRVGRKAETSGPNSPGLFRLIHLGPFEREIFLAYHTLRKPTIIESLADAPAGMPRSPPPAVDGDKWPRADVLVAAADIPAGAIVRRENLATRQVLTTFGKSWMASSDDRFGNSQYGMWAPQSIQAGHILSPSDLHFWTRVLVAAEKIAADSVFHAAALATELIPSQDGLRIVRAARLSEFDVSAWRAGNDLDAGDFLDPSDMQADCLKTTVTLNPGDIIRREHLVVAKEDEWLSVMTYIPATRIDQVVGRRITSRWPIQDRCFLCRDSVDYPPYRPATPETFRDGETLSVYRPRQPKIPPNRVVSAQAEPKEPPPPSASLVEAAGRGDLVALRQFLLASTNDPGTEGFGQEALAQAIQAGQTQAIPVLVGHGVSIEGDGRNPTPLMRAALSTNPDMLDVILDLGADLEARRVRGQTALMIAVNGGKGQNARRLLERGADVNARATGRIEEDWTALSAAVFCKHTDIAALLLDHGAGATTGALFIAAAQSDPVILALLAAHGADLRVRRESSQSTRGRTEWEGLIHQAASMGELKTMAWLLANGASIDEPGGGGNTPLMVAVEGRHRAAVNFLLEHGAAVNATNRIGMTALMKAVQVGDEIVDIVEALLDRGADPEIRWRMGQTALSIAAEFENPRCMERIVKRGPPKDAEPRLLQK